MIDPEELVDLGDDEDLDAPPFSLAGEEIEPEIPAEYIDDLIGALRQLETEADLFQHPSWPAFLDSLRAKEEAAITEMRQRCQTLDEFTAMRAMANTCSWVADAPNRIAKDIGEINDKLTELEREDHEREDTPQ